MGWWNLQRKEEWLFRGQICSKWTFQTSLERAIISFGTATKRIPNKSDADYENKLAVLHREILGAGLENYNVSNLEKGLLRRFMRQSHHYVTTLPSEENVMEWLALMQHYGAPTCLLDWTHSLFVAVYFAVEQADSECAVWALNLKWVERTIYDVLDKVASEALKEDRNVTKKETFKQVFDHGHGLVCPIKPYRFNERLVIQQGVFLVPGNVSIPFDDNLMSFLQRSDSKGMLVKLIIQNDATLRKTILQNLHHMNMNSATLFPGLDGFARSLRTLLVYPHILQP